MHKPIELSHIQSLANNREFPCQIHITDANIKQVWTILEPKFDEILRRGIHMETKTSVYELMRSGRLKLWLNVDTFVMCCVENLNVGRVLNIAFAFGNKENVLEIIEKSLKTYAKKMGCKYLYVCGRLGWKKFLKQSLFKEKITMLLKEI